MLEGHIRLSPPQPGHDLQSAPALSATHPPNACRKTPMVAWTAPATQQQTTGCGDEFVARTEYSEHSVEGP